MTLKEIIKAYHPLKDEAKILSFDTMFEYSKETDLTFHPKVMATNFLKSVAVFPKPVIRGAIIGTSAGILVSTITGSAEAGAYTLAGCTGLDAGIYTFRTFGMPYIRDLTKSLRNMDALPRWS